MLHLNKQTIPKKEEAIFILMNFLSFSNTKVFEVYKPNYQWKSIPRYHVPNTDKTKIYW